MLFQGGESYVAEKIVCFIVASRDPAVRTLVVRLSELP